ncbi:MAG: hypothetical protein RBS19_09540 [Bacteroidales bacterium]|nr:hypothetical protein [Bacteroidales bacterium]
MRLFFSTLFLSMIFLFANAQERSVKVDFESESFFNNPKIPFDKPFAISGEAGSEIEFVKVNISYQGKDFVLHSFAWNRCEDNKSETFNIVVPPILKSNTKYDFNVVIYKLLSQTQKEYLHKNIEDRVRFLLMNNIYFDGKKVTVNKPKDVYQKLSQLITESFTLYESKNGIPMQAPSALVLDELKKTSDFRFGNFFKKKSQKEIDTIARKSISDKVEHLVRLISSEITPYINSQLVQHHRQANITAVETDKEAFTLPVNIGVYAWNKTVNINNTSMQNIDFTPGIGLTIPFNNKSKLTSKMRMFDSFGFSTGVLFKSVYDERGTEFVTPGVNLPVYAGLGFRLFKVIRFNAGVLVIGEKGSQNYRNISVIPTAGLALELNLWMGIK